jgi:hypothetical protein
MAGMEEKRSPCAMGGPVQIERVRPNWFSRIIQKKIPAMAVKDRPHLPMEPSGDRGHRSPSYKEAWR